MEKLRILIVSKSIIPANLYGGINRVTWSLGKELVRQGHVVTFLVPRGSHCNFANVINLNQDKAVYCQIPSDFDLIHFDSEYPNIDQISTPYVITKHDNTYDKSYLNKNTIFISKDHARRYNSKTFVYNGLDWDEYIKPNFNIKRSYFHFLGKAAWRVKNLKGAIKVIKQIGSEKLKVIGGYRLNFKMGFRLTLSPKVRFLGMLGGVEKDLVINGSKGHIFPVIWHEPFGLATIESLYFGCPVFGTPYGSLPELINEEVGYLSNGSKDLANAILHSSSFSPLICHTYARDSFNSKKMTQDYLKYYERVLDGKVLNNKNPQLCETPLTKYLCWD